MGESCLLPLPGMMYTIRKRMVVNIIQGYAAGLGNDRHRSAHYYGVHSALPIFADYWRVKRECSGVVDDGGTTSMNIA